MTPHHRFANQSAAGGASSGAFAVGPAPVSGALAGARRAVTGFVRQVVRSHRERSDVAELRGLSDAALKDIGINRGEILRLVRQRYEDLEVGRHADH